MNPQMFGANRGLFPAFEADKSVASSAEAP
jgi:hypothetical protein